MIKNILWDFDRTLAFRNGMWTSTLKELLINHGFENEAQQDLSKYMITGFPWHHFDVEHHELFQGKTWWEYMHGILINILCEIKIPKSKSSTIVTNFKEAYLNVEKWNLYSDTVSALKKAQENGFRNYIFSNHVPELEELVESLDLGSYIEKTITSGLLGSEKPNILFFEKALNRISTSSEKCVMVGDSYKSDIFGANNASIKAILVHTENTESYEYYSKDLIGIFPVLEQFE